jgi:hypothetical protein
MRAHFRHLNSKIFSMIQGTLQSNEFWPLQSLSENLGLQFEIPTLKVGTHLGVEKFIPSHSPTFLGVWNVSPALHSWPAPSQAFVLVASPKLGLWHSKINNHPNTWCEINECMALGLIIIRIIFLCYLLWYIYIYIYIYIYNAYVYVFCSPKACAIN